MKHTGLRQPFLLTALCAAMLMPSAAALAVCQLLPDTPADLDGLRCRLDETDAAILELSEQLAESEMTLEELEASFPYIKGQQVIATDEEGDPLYEDVGPTPRFLTLSRRYLHDLASAADEHKH